MSLMGSNLMCRCTLNTANRRSVSSQPQSPDHLHAEVGWRPEAERPVRDTPLRPLVFRERPSGLLRAPASVEEGVGEERPPARVPTYRLRAAMHSIPLATNSVPLKLACGFGVGSRLIDGVAKVSGRFLVDIMLPYSSHTGIWDFLLVGTRQR